MSLHIGCFDEDFGNLATSDQPGPQLISVLPDKICSNFPKVPVEFSPSFTFNSILFIRPQNRLGGRK